MIGNSWFIIVSNLLYVIVVLFFISRMLRAASVYGWNYGRSSIQQVQKIKILTSIVVIAAVGIIAAMTNIFFG